MKYAISAIALAATGAGAAAADDFTLTILHINDLHSRIESINRYDSTCSAEDEAEGACFGGVARVKTAIDQRRAALAAEGRAVVTLDAGDQFQGSLFYTTYKGAAAAEFMNAIGFDAMAVGNHEFDDGPSALAAFLDASETPIISANVDASAEPLLTGRLQGATIVEAGGERIGIVSVVSTDTSVTSSPGPSIAFTDDLAALTAQVEALEADGVNKIVALTHVGLPRDIQLAAAAPGIDVIVGGHSHTLLSNTQERATGPYPVMAAGAEGVVPIVQAYAYSKFLGEVAVTFDAEGRVVEAVGEPHLLDASFTPDPEILARVAELGAPIEELKGQVVGETTAPIDGARTSCRTGECEMGVLVADAMLDRVRDQGVTIAIQNGGGLRASIDAGPVTMGEVLTVLPFQNTLATFQLQGVHVRAALENGLSAVEDGAGRFPQVAGMRYTWSASKPAGERLVSVEVAEGDGWAPLDDDAIYGVVSNNFMRKGGDGYSVFSEHGENAYDFGPGLELVVVDFLSANGAYTPGLDGRVTMVE